MMQPQEPISTTGFLDKERLAAKLNAKGIPTDCIGVIENGLYEYMQNIIGDVFSVLTMVQNNDENFRKKIYNFYPKDVMKRTKEESEFSKVTLTDPLGEYKHVEKVDLEEQKLFENKLSTRDQKGEEDNKSQAPGKNIDPKKKKKVVFDDVSLIFTLNHFSGLTLNYSTLKFTKSCTKTSLRGRKTMIILGKTLRIKTSASECSQKAIGITGETVK